MVLIEASRDPLRQPVARANPELAIVAAAVMRLVGERSLSRNLQAPLSFRVAGPALAQFLRSITALEHAVERALDGVTDSPAFLEGRFTGTAGFDGFDLAAALDGLRLSLIHLAEVSAARLHRLLDERITGLPRQLTDRPGLHGGMVAVHKRAVGVVHGLLRGSQPASLGAIETSLGQEDVQSFSLESVVACGEALEGARDVLACELLALVQADRLRGGTTGRTELQELLDRVAGSVAPGTGDRPFGLDIEGIGALLATGWARGLLAVAPSTPAE
jgi:histidine ammonia-lyase